MSSAIETPYGGSFLISGAARQSSTPENLPEDAAELAAAIDKFTRAELPGFAAGLKAHERGLMPALLKKAAELGLTAAGLPEAYGGLSLPFTYQALLAEKTATNPPFSVSSGVAGCLAPLPIVLFGTEDQKQQWLPRMASGELFGAFALTEEEAGTGALACRCTATPLLDGTNLLNGSKQWITNGAFAGLYVVFAQIPEAGLSAFLVDTTLPGVSHGKEEHKIGLKGSSTTRLAFENVSLPAAALLGKPGQGAAIATAALNPARLIMAASALGLAKEALAISARYAAERHQNGQPIASYGLIRQKLGRITFKIYGAESALYRLAGELDTLWATDPIAAAQELAIECAIVKTVCSEVLGAAADEAVQILGGYGCSEDYAAAGIFRDARVFRIFYGTNEINRLQMVRQLFKRAASHRLPLHSEIEKEFGHGEDGMAKALLLLETLNNSEWDSEHPLSAADTSLETSEYTRLAALCAAAVVRSISTAELEERQELAGVLADLLTNAYIMESVSLRISQSKGSEELLSATARQLGYTSTMHSWQLLQSVFACRWHGPLEATHVRRWREVFAAPADDVLPLEQKMGEITALRGGYPRI